MTFNARIITNKTLTRIYALIDWWILRKATSNISIVSPIVRVFYYQIMKGRCARISHKTDFQGKPVLPHGLSGIFISSGSKIGRQAVIFHQVTIGAVTTIDSKKRGSPTIGNNCYIGAGAKIIGNIKIGDNVRISANAVVHDDVPDNSVVTLGTQVIRHPPTPLNNRYYFCKNGKWVYADDEGKYQMCENNGERP